MKQARRTSQACSCSQRPLGVAALLARLRGTFVRPREELRNRAGAPDSVAVGDLNGDGKPDLAIANGNVATVTVLLNNGDGTFRPSVTTQVGHSATRSRSAT